MGRRLLRWLVGLATCGIAALAVAQDFSFSAKVDKTAVDVGDPITLTLTLTGDFSSVVFPPIEFPEGFSVAARSQATNFSIRGGAMERSGNLVYVLIPQREGTHQLGPFTIEHQKKTFTTEQITVTVKRSAVPPTLKPSPGERFTI